MKRHIIVPFTIAFLFLLSCSASFADDPTSLLWSTFLDGDGYETFDFGSGIAVDDSGNAYVTGDTQSSDFPIMAGAFDTTYGGYNGDAFVAKLNSTGTALVYSTYLVLNCKNNLSNVYSWAGGTDHAQKNAYYIMR